MGAEIVVSFGGKTIETVSLRKVLTIGRNKGNSLVLTDGIVSRNHALIRKEGRHYLLVDLGSSNGTFLNNQPVSFATVLTTGDEICMGKTVLQFFDRQPQQSTDTDASINEPTARVFAPVTLSIFVTDIRNYTTLSEQIPSDEFSHILSDWFTTAGRCIAENGGTVEHFRGDSVAAYWLANPKDDSNEFIAKTVKTAQQLIKESRAVDQDMSRRFPGKSFRIGCGVHTGKAVFGTIGLDARRDFTILGDSVNVTYRIEGLCSQLGKEILVSDRINSAVGDVFSFEDMGQHRLKGKADKFRLYTLV